MKKMKKIVALLTAAVMALGMSTMAFADDPVTPTKGSITINNATKKTNEGDDNTYTAYQIFSANPTGDGDDSSAPTNTADGTVAYFANDDQYDALKDSGLFVFTETASGLYSVTIADGKAAADIADYFNTNKATLATALADYATNLTFTASSADGNGKAVATATNLDFGYYFVTSTNGSVVSVDTTNYDVVIEDKNSYGDPFTPEEGLKVKGVKAINGEETEKYAEGDTIPDGYAVGDYKVASANIGDVLTYEVSTKTSNFVVDETSGNQEKVTYVFVTDTLGGGLEYQEDDNYEFTVTIGGVEAQEFANGDDTTVNSASAPKYTIEWDGPSPTETNTFTITIPWLDEDGNAAFASGTVVTVEYSAVITEDVDVAEGEDPAENASNALDVKYNSTPETDDDGPFDPDYDNATEAITDTSDVYIYALAIKKVDGQDNSIALKGATFTITDADDNPIIADFDEDKGYYVIGKEGATNTEFVTDDDGLIIIYGIAAGTYTATETVAPAGYNLLEGTADFEAITAVTTTTTQTVTKTTYYKSAANGEYGKTDDGEFFKIEGEYNGTRYEIVSADTQGAEPGISTIEADLPAYAVSVGVENNQGSELPSTGGIGTTIFYIVGAILVIGAGVMLVTRRRMAV